MLDICKYNIYRKTRGTIMKKRVLKRILLTLAFAIAWTGCPNDETVATPTISPNGGDFFGSQIVTLASITAEATLYYTLDNSEPTVESTPYSSPLTITETTTVKTIGVKEKFDNSVIASATFTKKLSIETVFVEGGTFTMGTAREIPDELPVRQVTLKSFYIGKHEVTQEQWEIVMGSTHPNPSSNKPATNWKNLPVDQVSWYDAIEFCNTLSHIEGLSPYYTIDKNNNDPNNTSNDPNDPKWLITPDTTKNGYRLPTEAEWEYAAGWNGTSPRFIYASTNDTNRAGDYAWYGDNSEDKTHLVGTMSANTLGHFDMSGNVFELCWDWYAETYTGLSNDNPTGISKGYLRVIRGGSFLSDLNYCRVACRGVASPSNRKKGIGFRVVHNASIY